MKRSKLLTPVVALMIIMSAMFFSVPAYASAEPPLENLTVDAVWLEGETLYIEVTDNLTGINQTLQLPLDEYSAGSEYVSVQAVDRNGNTSNTIQFKNPFYTPDTDGEPVTSSETPPTESGVPADDPADGLNPFTPDGTGTVIDNATDGDGKEFFSIETEDGNVFYLIVDRQRSSENVYLLNAVTENDLLSLAKPGDGTSESGIPTQTPPEPTEPLPTETPEPVPTEPAENGGMGSGTVIFVIVAAAAVGGAGYYFKILRPKKQAAEDTDDVDDYDEDEDYGDEDYGEPGEESEDE